MDLKFKWIDSFYICGYFVETSLDTCDEDLSKLWSDFEFKKEELFNIYGYKEDFYGLMWYTDNHRYCYLIGIEVDNIDKMLEGAIYKYISGTDYAIAYVSADISAIDAWTDYFDKILPDAGYIPNTKHGYNFEYYPNGHTGEYELWTPVIRSGKNG